jgi:hypothetical protein
VSNHARVTLASRLPFRLGRPMLARSVSFCSSKVRLGFFSPNQRGSYRFVAIALPPTPSPPPGMETSTKKLSSLRITSLDDDDDETEIPHQPPQAGLSTAEADYEDDDDEEEEAEVTLGVLSKPKHPGLLLRHLFPSKAGGIPVRALTRLKFQ